MKFSQIYQSKRPVLSFELFPPKTDAGMEALESRLPKLVGLEPDLITVTYGAMGSTRDRTLEIACRIKEGFGMEVAHHLTCVGHDRDELQRLLEQIRDCGIENLVALRGDPPQGSTVFETAEGGYSHAAELVEQARRMRAFGIAVAGYPETHIEASNRATDLRHLKNKVDKGADVVITQLFYDNAHFYRFRDECRLAGIEAPIVPGLLPVLNLKQIERITKLCGCGLPPRLLKELQTASDNPERVFEIGIRHTVAQVLDLLEQGVDGIHFYILNRYFHIAEIIEEVRRLSGKRLDRTVSSPG